MSFGPDGTIDQLAEPFCTVMARFVSLSVTLFFFPAMTHWPFVRVTLTSGAPHCSRVNGCSDGCATAIPSARTIRMKIVRFIVSTRLRTRRAWLSGHGLNLDQFSAVRRYD